MSDKKLLLRSVAAGAFCGLLGSVILMCIFAVVLMKIGLLESGTLDLVTAGFLGAGALAGGFISAKLNRGAGLIAGALTGALMIVLLVIVSAFRNKADFTLLLLIKSAAAVIGGALGGILAVREKRHKGF